MSDRQNQFVSDYDYKDRENGNFVRESCFYRNCLGEREFILQLIFSTSHEIT